LRGIFREFHQFLGFSRMLASPPAKQSQAFHYEVVERVILSLEGRLDESLTLSTIANFAFLSRFHFNRVFRQITGVPPCQFFYAMRLAEAKTLLLTTRFKVIDICYEVGYRSLGTFTRRFTELVGISPSRFRSMAQAAKHRPVELPVIDLPRQDTGAVLSGDVSVPDRFNGVIFIGLFREPIPQGEPTSCAIVTGPGPFSIRGVSEGSFYLFAMALEAPLDAARLLHARAALRAGGQRIRVSGGLVWGDTDLALRPPERFDAPILVAIPPLLSARAGRESSTQERSASDQKNDLPAKKMRAKAGGHGSACESAEIEQHSEWAAF
jgi:AraC family transcriptional regulator